MQNFGDFLVHISYINSMTGRCPKKKESCLFAERNFGGETLNYTKLIYVKRSWKQVCLLEILHFVFL